MDRQVMILYSIMLCVHRACCSDSDSIAHYVSIEQIADNIGAAVSDVYRAVLQLSDNRNPDVSPWLSVDRMNDRVTITEAGRDAVRGMEEWPYLFSRQEKEWIDRVRAGRIGSRDTPDRAAIPTGSSVNTAGGDYEHKYLTVIDAVMQMRKHGVESIDDLRRCPMCEKLGRRSLRARREFSSGCSYCRECERARKRSKTKR